MNSAASIGAVSHPSFCYEQRKPEETLLYQLVEQYYPALKVKMDEEGKPLPMHV
jgi:hypothetical protein